MHYIKKPIIQKSCDAYYARIFIAGPIETIRRVCQEYMMDHPLCVYISSGEYVYTGGIEIGHCVQLINYARFPAEFTQIKSTAIDLAEYLLRETCQLSCTILTPSESIFLELEGMK